ncbi:hypothetical protein HZC21_02765 [Candidatus Peregrinibacteria bacterium]|nr:hypothetical protein [Candidatus Peregrinibacteria bacterium]
MKKFWVKRQKEIGITLIILGIALLISIIGYLYSFSSEIKGFSQFLPANDTVLYFEFPAVLDSNGALTQKINQFLNIDWNKDVVPLGASEASAKQLNRPKGETIAGEKGAFAFLKNNDSKRIFPAVFLQVKSREQALQFLSDYKKLPADNEIVFLDEDTLFLASSLYKPSSGARLSENKEFIRLRQNLKSSWFVYADTKNFGPEIENLISQIVPYMPFTLSAFKAVGISAENSGAIWQGHSYAINQNDFLVKNEQAYRALLLPFLPSDFNFVVSGQNLPGQIAKMDILSNQQAGKPLAKDFLSVFKKQYFGSENFERLFSKEFAAAINGNKVLILAESAEKNQGDSLEFFRSAFIKNAESFTLRMREVELPDGTKAKEFIADSSRAKTFQEDFYGIKINGSLIGDKNAIYDAATQGKLFISNDLSTLKKSLLLTRERGLNFRETSAYREFLQPIFKNPELAGIAASEEGTFSFSKRTFGDHMETSFIFMIK